MQYSVNFSNNKSYKEDLKDIFFVWKFIESGEHTICVFVLKSECSCLFLLSTKTKYVTVYGIIPTLFTKKMSWIYKNSENKNLIILNLKLRFQGKVKNSPKIFLIHDNVKEGK